MRIKYILAVVFLLFGCTHMRSASNMDDMNLEMIDEITTISFQNGDLFEAIDVELTADSTTWFDTDSGKEHISSNKDIKAIILKDKTRGIVDGFALGIMFGMVTGALVGYSEGDDSPDTINRFSREEKALLRGFIFAGIGGMLGVPIGNHVGSRKKYMIPDEFEMPTDTTAATALHMK